MLEVEKKELSTIVVLGFGRLGKRVINLGIDEDENFRGRYININQFMSEENSAYYSKMVGEANILIILFDWDEVPEYVLPLIEAAKRRKILILGIAAASKGLASVDRESFEKLISGGMDAIYTLNESAYSLRGDTLPEEVAKQAISTIKMLLNVPCIINLDLDDVSVMLKGERYFQVGLGHGKGDDKAAEAAQMAVNSCWNTLDMSDASKYMLLVSGDITLTDVSDVSEYVRENSKREADIIFGAFYSEEETDACEVVMMASGFEI